MSKDYFLGFSEKEIYEAASHFPRNQLLAQYLNIPRSTFYAKLKQREDVKDLLKSARLGAVREVMQSLKDTAISGNVTAQIYYLKLMGVDDDSVDIRIEFEQESLGDAEKLSKWSLAIFEAAAKGEIGLTKANLLIELGSKVAAIYMLPQSIAALTEAEKEAGIKR